MTVTSKLPIPPHTVGKSAFYHRGCRCRPCTSAVVRKDKERRYNALHGRPASIPASTVLPHLKGLAGTLSHRQIARLSNTEHCTIARLLDGRQLTLYRTTADRLLAVPLSAEPVSGYVPGTGAIRRLQGLYALGHYNGDIADDSGLSRDFITELTRGVYPTLNARHDKVIKETYGRLSMRVGQSWQTRRLAARMGWAPPLAWDDDTIDDPGAVPALDAARPRPSTSKDAAACWLAGESVILNKMAQREVIHHLMEWTPQSVAEIADELEIGASSVSRTWERIKERARKEGQPVPRRRAYLTAKELGLDPVEQAEMSKDEMESAA